LFKCHNVVTLSSLRQCLRRCPSALFDGVRTETRSCSITCLLFTYLLGTVLRTRSPENENTCIIFSLTAFLSVGTIHYQSCRIIHPILSQHAVRLGWLLYDIQKGLRALLLDCADSRYVGTFVPVLFTRFRIGLADCSKRRGSAACMHVCVPSGREL
jgi:hypothetical protein